MIDPFTIAAIMAAKNEFIDKPKIAERNQKMANAAAAQTEFSPWTGNGHGTFTPQGDSDTIGSAVQGYQLGNMMNQATNRAEADTNLVNANADKVRSSITPPPSKIELSSPKFQDSPMTTIQPLNATSGSSIYDYMDTDKLKGVNRSIASQGSDSFNIYDTLNFNKNYSGY